MIKLLIIFCTFLKKKSPKTKKIEKSASNSLSPWILRFFYGITQPDRLRTDREKIVQKFFFEKSYFFDVIMHFGKFFHQKLELIPRIVLILHLSESVKKWPSYSNYSAKNLKFEKRLVPPPP